MKFIYTIIFHTFNYADKYRASNKIIIGIGVNFVPEDKEINEWETEIL